MHRRTLILGSGAALLGAGEAAAGALSDPALPAGTREVAEIASPPGKTKLIRLTDRPPNYETPLDAFRSPITPNDRFFIRYHLSEVPRMADLKDWTLTLGGDAAGGQARLKLADLRKLPAHEVVAVCQCAGSRRGLFSPHVAGVQWSVGAMGCASWRGARLQDVLKLVGLRPDALEVRFHGTDHGPLDDTPIFRKSLPIARAMDPNTLIAWEMNGAPLPLANGFPARIVVPGWAATYWMKHVADIEITSKADDGFWMQKAYRVPRSLFPAAAPFASQDTAQTSPVTDLVVNTLLTDPVEGARVHMGGFEVRGIAWDGGSGIRQVEVSVDDGKTWQAATLGKDPGPYAFRTWRHPIARVQRGEVALRVRATANSGAVQPEQLVFNPAGYNNNVIRTVRAVAA
jgi:DMSO/TMAO reductase YedYZ molybdopterin-dependent catalytic subunit